MIENVLVLTFQVTPLLCEFFVAAGGVLAACTDANFIMRKQVQ